MFRKQVTLQPPTILPVLIGMCLCSFVVHSMSLADEPKISVKGHSEIRLAADEIVLAVAIESRAKTAAIACKDNREKSNQLHDFLKSIGIEDKLINEDPVSIDPIYPDPNTSRSKGGYKGQAAVQQSIPTNAQNAEDPFGGSESLDSSLGAPPNPVGYKATRHFTLVIKDFKKFEEIYQGIVDKGVYRVESVRYRSSQEKSQHEKLRRLAVRDAKARAESMANELGAKLSAIQSIGGLATSLDSRELRSVYPGSRAGYGGMDPFGSDNPAESTEPITSKEQITLRASVDVVFFLGNAVFK